MKTNIQTALNAYMAPHTQNTPQSWSSCCWPLSVFHLLSNYLVGTINTSIHTPKTFTHTHTHTLSACLFEWCFVEGMSGPLCVAPACARYPQRQREGCLTHTHALKHTSTHTPLHVIRRLNCMGCAGAAGVTQESCEGCRHVLVCVCECVTHGRSQPVHSK